MRNLEDFPARMRELVRLRNRKHLTAADFSAGILDLAAEMEGTVEKKGAADRMEYACTCPSGDGSLRWPCPRHPLMRVQDRNVEAVREKILERSRNGIAQYGATTERTDMSRDDWLREAQEELMDAAVYIEAALASSGPGGGGGEG